MKNKALKWLSAQINDETTVAEMQVIDFLKKLVRDYKVPEKKPEFDWSPMFETLWKLYPRKANKQLAKRTFEHKVRGLNEEECKQKCNLIYKMQITRTKQWENEGRALQYYPHYSSLLNSEVPNSPKYKGV